MRCEAVHRELSGAMDQGLAALDTRGRAHLDGCPRCRAFERGAWRLREAVRLEPAAPVPDLVPAIMEQVRRESGSPARVPPPGRWRREVVAFAAAALVAALVVGGLPVVRRAPQPVSASEIPRRVAAASTEVTSYRASLEVVERNFLPQVPVRRFQARIAFQAPERFRAEVRDLTAYPDASWPRNEMVLAIDGHRWSFVGPPACPREALPGCAVGGQDVRSVGGREPFDGETLLPTDLILPVKTLSGAGRLRVLGSGTVRGRPTVTVELVYRDATPLFASIQTGGVWRPFHPLDRVEVSLDRRTWFPQAYRVIAAGGMEREAWAARHGLRGDRPGMVLFQAEVRTFRPSVPEGWSPRVPGAADRDAGFRDVPPTALAHEVGFSPMAPEDLRGLEPYRAGISAGPATAVTTFTRGLSWLKIRETRSWQGPGLFGDLGSLAAPVALPGGGMGYYEPPGATRGARLGMHADGTDLFLEANLPREDLLAVAGSLPIRGLRAPDAWRTRRLPGGTLHEGVSMARARRAVPGLLLPGTLPPEYRLWTVHLLEGSERAAVTAFFRRPRGELDGAGIRLHQEPGAALPPPTDPGALAVDVRGTLARYSPLRGELEWVEGGTYRSVQAEGLGLSRLVWVAESLRPPPEGGGG